MELPAERRMRFWIEVNLGDVIEQDDGTLYGDGVNIAARMEALAELGGVYASDSACGQVEGKLPLDFRFAGEHQVKNIAEPVRADHVAVQPAAEQAPPAQRRRRVQLCAG